LAPLYWLASRLLKSRIESQGILSDEDARLAELFMRYSRSVVASGGGPEGAAAQAFREEHAEELARLPVEQGKELERLIGELWRTRQAAPPERARAAVN